MDNVGIIPILANTVNSCLKYKWKLSTVLFILIFNIYMKIDLL